MRLCCWRWCYPRLVSALIRYCGFKHGGIVGTRELSRETGQHFVMGILLDSLFVANSKKKTSANFLLYFTPQQQQLHQASRVLLHCTTVSRLGSSGSCLQQQPCCRQSGLEREWGVARSAAGPGLLLVLRAVVVRLLAAVTPGLLWVREDQCTITGEWWHYYRSNYQQNIKMEYWVMFFQHCIKIIRILYEWYNKEWSWEVNESSFNITASLPHSSGVNLW